MLETEKSSSKQNLDDLVTIATEQNICAEEKIAEVSVVLYLIVLFCSIQPPKCSLLLVLSV